MYNTQEESNQGFDSFSDSKVITVNLNVEQVRQMQIFRKLKMCSISAFVREAIEQFLIEISQELMVAEIDEEVPEPEITTEWDTNNGQLVIDQNGNYKIIRGAT